jgi:hypothetical protein
MPKLISRASDKKPSKSPIKRRRNALHSEVDAMNVSNWLNNCLDTEGKSRVLAIMDLLRDMREVLQDPFVKKHAGTWSHYDSHPLVKRFNASYNDLRSRLDRYTFTPFVIPPMIFGMTWTTQWAPAAKTGQAKHEAAVMKSLKQEHLAATVLVFGSEIIGVQFVLRAVDSGALDRVALCGRCEKWFAKKFVHQAYCGEKCRIAHFRSTPAYREQRNEYARKLYLLQKTKNVK